MATCSSCKNLDTKKKVNGANGGAKYNCKKLKKYVAGDMNACDKYAKCFRSVDDCNKIYHEGRNWDNDKLSVSSYLVIAIIIIVVLALVYLFNPDLY